MSVDSQPSVIHSHQLNYKPVHEANPKYRFLRLPLNNITGSSTTISATSTQLLEFKLPNTVYNLAQSFLGYSITTPDVTGRVNWVQEDSFDIASNVYFGNASGLDVCNLSYASKYIKMARKIKTKFQDFVSNDTLSALYPSNALASNNYCPVDNQSNLNPAAYKGVINYTEPRYVVQGASGDGAGAGVFLRHRQYPLHGIVDTIFAVDKDLYIPTDMYIRITAGGANQFSFTSGSTTEPSTTASTITTDLTLSNIYLYLAVETNQLIIDSVINKVLSDGIKLNIPYTVSFRNSQANGTVANINLQLSSQYGKTLKQIMHTVWHGTEQYNTTLDCGNYNGSKIQRYNTFMNSRQLQDSNIVCNNSIIANYDDWRENERFIRGSVIANRNIYAMNWFHLDRWYEDNNGTLIAEENRVDGFDMSKGPALWQLQATTASGAWNHYTFATFNRDIVIDRQGIRFDI
jgi:hypothetical protein